MRFRQDASWQWKGMRNAGGVWEAPSAHPLKVVTALEQPDVAEEAVHLMLATKIQIPKCFIIQ